MATLPSSILPAGFDDLEPLEIGSQRLGIALAIWRPSDSHPPRETGEAPTISGHGIDTALTLKTKNPLFFLVLLLSFH